MVSAKAWASSAAASNDRHVHPTRRQLPLIAIAGSAGKSTVAWMLNDILAHAGHEVAAWLSSGVYIGGIRYTNEIHAWERAVLAARAREIDILIQELSAPLTLGIGLRPRSYKVGLVTTICGTDDRCQRIPDTLREIEAIDRLMDAITEDGVAIGNADDVLVVEQLERTSARRILFALNRRNPALRHHLEAGGQGAWLQNGWVVFGSAIDEQRVLRVADVRAAYGGALGFQVQNALAAICCAVAIGVDVQLIAAALREFEPDRARLPGRCNVVEYRGVTVIVDSPRLVQSVRGLCRGVRALGARRTIAMIDEGVDLDGESVVEAGRTIGSVAGVVILCGDAYSDLLRDIREGLAQADTPPVILAFSEQSSAFGYLTDSLHDGDAALIVTGSAPDVLSRLRTPNPAPVTRH